jgi:hypothetical protein
LGAVVLLLMVMGGGAAAVLAVTLFAEEVSERFGYFDAAFLTLFLVTAGDPWPEALPLHNEDGTANWVAGGFVAGFTIVVVWVVLQVRRKQRVAV